MLEFSVILCMSAATDVVVTTAKKTCHFEQREKSAVGGVEQKQISHPINLGSK